MTIKNLTSLIVKFRDEREWKQFNNPKDVAISLNLEASEVLEHFQWKNKREIDEYIQTHREEIGEELADTLYWVLDLHIDIAEAFVQKMKKNEAKYPVSQSKGKHTKYTKL